MIEVPRVLDKFNPDIPQFLPGACKHWPAVSKWTPDYFLKHFPHEKLNINTYSENEILPYFFQNYLASEFKTVSEIFDSNEKYSAHELTSFLKNNELLLDDLDFYAPFLKSRNLPEELFYSFWYGSKNSVTDLHSDNVDLILFQIKSKKTVRLLNKETDQEKLQIITKEETLKFFEKHNIPMNEKIAATIQLKTSSYSKIKAFQDQSHSYYEVILNPGDAIFIPKNWWHSTKSHDSSIAVNLELLENHININSIK